MLDLSCNRFLLKKAKMLDPFFVVMLFLFCFFILILFFCSTFKYYDQLL